MEDDSSDDCEGFRAIALTLVNVTTMALGIPLVTISTLAFQQIHYNAFFIVGITVGSVMLLSGVCTSIYMCAVGMLLFFKYLSFFLSFFLSLLKFNLFV